MKSPPNPRAFIRGFSVLPILLTAVAVGCSRSSPEGHLIGHVAPRSGADRAAGERLGHALALVVDESNAEDPKRIERRPLSAVHADTGESLDGFASQATRLLAVNRVSALIGGVNSYQLARLVGPIQANSTVLVSASGALPDVTSQYIWAVGLQPAERGKWLARHAVVQMRISEVVTVTDLSNSTFVAIRGGFEAEFRHADRRIRAERSFTKPAELSDLASRVVAESPKAILFCGRAADLTQFRGYLQSAKMSVDVPVLFGGDEEEPILRLEPVRTEGVVFVSAFTCLDTNDRVQKFCTDFRSRTGHLPDAVDALTADAARILFAAAAKAQTFRVKSLPEELAKVELDLATGPFWFTREQAARRTSYLLQMKDGRSQLLKTYPAEKK